MNTFQIIMVSLILAAWIFLVWTMRKEKARDYAKRIDELAKTSDFASMKRILIKLIAGYGVITLCLLSLAVKNLVIHEITMFLIELMLALLLGGVRIFIYSKTLKWVLVGYAEFSFTFTEQDEADLWNNDDDGNFIAELSQYLHKKSWFGKKMDPLTEEEKIVYIVSTLEGEVENGGFSQFFQNTQNAFYDDIVSACLTVGAVKTSHICEHAVEIARLNLSEDEIDEKLDKECDNAFFSSEEDLNALCAAYARANRDKILVRKK